MKNRIIENFAEKSYKEMKETIGLIQRIETNVLTQDRLLWEMFPVNGSIAVMPHFPPANYIPSARLHAHDFFEMVYIYRGSAVQHLENRTLQLEEGAICLMNTNCRHGLSVDSDEPIVFNILINRKLVNASFLNLLDENDLFSEFFIGSLFSRTEYGEYFYFEKTPASHVEFLMQSLLEEYILQKPGYRSAMQSYLSLIFTELRRYDVYHSGKQDAADINFPAIMSYITAHLEDVTLNSLADHFHYTPAHLSRLLKQYLGQTFSALLGDLRLEKAAAYLKNTSISIDSIVELLGYYDRSYFNRVFKKKYGCSPNEYREKAFVYAK